MPRALKSRGHQRVSPENSSVTRYSPSRYPILTTVLLNARAQHAGRGGLPLHSSNFIIGLHPERAEPE